MSQRLAVAVMDGDDILAVAQYAWGAYTKCAASVMDDFVNAIKFARFGKERDGKVYRVMRVLEKLGGSLIEERPSSLLKVQELSAKYGRGHKFTSFKEKDGDFLFSVFDWKNTFIENACGRIEIDLSDHTVMFDVFSYYTKEMFNEFKNHYKKNPEKIRFDFPFHGSFEAAAELAAYLRNVSDKAYFKAGSGFVAPIF